MKHPIIVLQPIQSERDLFFGRGTLVNLDEATAPVIKVLREEWRSNPLCLGGDIIYLFNQNLPFKMSEEEKDTPSQ